MGLISLCFLISQAQYKSTGDVTFGLYESQNDTKHYPVKLMECGTMNMFKIAMVGAATLGVVLASSASNAETIRAGAATPGVVSVKKTKILRTTAPASRELREVSATDVGLGLLAGGVVGVGVYEATKSSDSNGG